MSDVSQKVENLTVLPGEIRNIERIFCDFSTPSSGPPPPARRAAAGQKYANKNYRKFLSNSGNLRNKVQF
jgi:hypothetical protein